MNAPNRTDKEGLRTGEWVIYFQQDDQVTDNPSGATRYYLVNYKRENRKDSREYAIDGTLVWEGELRSVLPDTIHGVSRGFSRDGTVSCYEYTFADGLMQGPPNSSMRTEN